VRRQRKADESGWRNMYWNERVPARCDGALCASSSPERHSLHGIFLCTLSACISLASPRFSPRRFLSHRRWQHLLPLEQGVGVGRTAPAAGRVEARAARQRGKLRRRCARLERAVRPSAFRPLRAPPLDSCIFSLRVRGCRLSRSSPAMVCGSLPFVSPIFFLCSCPCYPSCCLYAQLL